MYLKRFDTYYPYVTGGSPGEQYLKTIVKQRRGCTFHPFGGESISLRSSKIHWMVSSSPKFWLHHTYLINPEFEYVGIIDDDPYF